MQYYNNQNYYQPYYMPLPDPEAQRRYHADMYKKNLRRTSNGLGALLLVFIGLELVISVVLSMIATFSGGIGIATDASFDLILNGLVSSVIFFVAGVIYCLIRKQNFSRLFPFERVGGSMLIKLSIIGIAFSLMSNYVVDLINGTFGLFGIENNGGNIDVGSAPDVLLYILVVAILPAFVEEFAFRGVVMGVLRPYSEGLAILISSAAFALMHGNFVQLPFTFCCGLVFAFIDIKTNSLLPSIIVHFLNNGLSVITDILTSYEVIDMAEANMLYGGIFAITGILSFVFIRSIISEKGNSFFTVDGGSDLITFKEKVKTVAFSPAMIAFTVVMLIACLLVMTTGVL